MHIASYVLSDLFQELVIVSLLMLTDTVNDMLDFIFLISCGFNFLVPLYTLDPSVNIFI